MGTSVNQSSPRTLSWKVAQAGYRDPKVSIDRVTSEVWRAALNQESGDIERLLSQPVVARIGALASGSVSRVDLAKRSAAEIAKGKHSSLATDIARRAAVQVAGAGNWAEVFAPRLFAEATTYLVSRDLPGFVGLGRVRTVAESMSFRQSVANRAAQIVASVPRPGKMTERTWPEYVRNVVLHLRGRQ